MIRNFIIILGITFICLSESVAQRDRSDINSKYDIQKEDDIREFSNIGIYVPFLIERDNPLGIGLKYRYNNRLFDNFYIGPALDWVIYNSPDEAKDSSSILYKVSQFSILSTGLNISYKNSLIELNLEASYSFIIGDNTDKLEYGYISTYNKLRVSYSFNPSVSFRLKKFFVNIGYKYHSVVIYKTFLDVKDFPLGRTNMKAITLGIYYQWL